MLSHDPSQRSDPKTDGPAGRRRAGCTTCCWNWRPTPACGDLNDRKIVRRRSVTEADGRRQPGHDRGALPGVGRWPAATNARRLADDDQPFTLTVAGPNRTTTGTTPVDDAELRRHWFDVFYVDYEIELADSTTIAIENASVRLFGDGAVRRQATVAELLDWLGDATAGGLRRAVPPEAVGHRRGASTPPRPCSRPTATSTRTTATSSLVEIDEIAVCADVEVEPSADIELVQARIWFEIERYLDPPVEFWSLDELLRPGRAGRGDLQRARAGQRLPHRAGAPRHAICGPSCGCRTSSTGSSTSTA